MVMTRYDKAVSLAQRIDAARGRKRAAKKKAKREASKSKDSTTLSPEKYREQHGRCPDGYEYDPLSDTCEPKDAEEKDEREEETRDAKDEAKDERQTDDKKAQDDQAKDDTSKDKAPLKPPPSPKTPGDWLDGRKERGDYLEKLFHEDFDKYKSEAKRMREAGELPDRDTAVMLSKIKNVDDLPKDVLQDKEKLAKVIAQQDAQRRVEELTLQHAEQKLKDLAKQREVALKAGKTPPKLNPFKFLNDIEEMYNRDLGVDPERVKQILDQEEDQFAQIVSDSATKPGEPAYWWKKWWEKVTRPIPVWTPGGSTAFEDLGLDKLTGASVRRSGVSTTARTSPGVTNMAPSEIGFPPYDRDRQPRRYIADQPSGRPAFPPYDEVVTVEYKDRDARMQGFPPYDGKGEPHDSETIGLPPYNKKKPHKGRGFPPYHDGSSVYEHRRRTVDLAVK